MSTTQPVLTAMRDRLTPDLSWWSVAERTWNSWVNSRDREFPSRLPGGEEDTLTHLFGVGVTYTKQLHISFRDLLRYCSRNRRT